MLETALIFVVFLSKAFGDVEIHALDPQGIKVSIPNEDKLFFFAFHGNINRPIGKDDVGTISDVVSEPANGKWEFEDRNVTLKVGDVINYYIFKSVDGLGLIEDNLSKKIEKLEKNCKESITKVRGKQHFCAGDVIFEENFDSLKEDLWQIEQFIPMDSPAYPFVSYQRLIQNPTVKTKDGLLNISATLQQNLPGFTNESIYTSTLDLFYGCTRSADLCYKQATGFNILPPVVTGRVTSRLAFYYGTVEIRAKFPMGDWLYPELFLEPSIKRYGFTDYTSGLIQIASARGNNDFLKKYDRFDSAVLYGGLIVNSKCLGSLQSVRKSYEAWANDFHNYSITWTPQTISLSVDGKKWAEFDSNWKNMLRNSNLNCHQEYPTAISNMAPFDDYFFITLGLAAGGVMEFEDGLTRNRKPWRNTKFADGLTMNRKPWGNTESKGMLHFWQAMDSWYPTWIQPELLVDYVKITAL